MKFETLTLEDITINYDKKRVPLSTMQRESRKGSYRYYGAQGVIDYIDDYIFDGSKESVRKQIGMAVPCKGAKIIFEAILKTFAGIEYESMEASLRDEGEI